MPGFLNPALLAALAGVAVPLVLHLLGRRQGKPVRFAPIRFVLASEKRLRRRRRLTNLLLLGLRVLIVAAAALAVARPILDTGVAATAEAPVSAVAVTVISLPAGNHASTKSSEPPAVVSRSSQCSVSQFQVIDESVRRVNVVVVPLPLGGTSPVPVQPVQR